MKHKSFFIVGGAGFIGSHFVDRLLGDPEVAAVTIYDNVSSGREWHYAAHLTDSRFRVERGDVNDLGRLKAAMEGHQAVIHLASNPDIARAATEPDIDFREGTLLTNHVRDSVLTVAYLANQFPAAVEPYVGEEIREMRQRGVHVIAGSVRR